MPPAPPESPWPSRLWLVRHGRSTGNVPKRTGKDPLRRSKTDGSYWIPRTKPRAHDHFERLF